MEHTDKFMKSALPKATQKGDTVPPCLNAIAGMMEVVLPRTMKAVVSD
jgi:hypothetical protein